MKNTFLMFGYWKVKCCKIILILKAYSHTILFCFFCKTVAMLTLNDSILISDDNKLEISSGFYYVFLLQFKSCR